MVRASAARPAIQRILDADNLDVETLPAAEVAARMAAIPRGAAPADFWVAYRQHVRAWSDFAEARVKAQAGQVQDQWAIGDARVRINLTFEEVETIARAYGISTPIPRTRF